jgi:hypothetical protein
MRPTSVLAVGVIGDSFCPEYHRFSARFNVDDHECTLGCVRHGAEFVLITETQVYRIRNQQWPDLATFANLRVKVEGTLDGDRIVVAKMSAANTAADSPISGLR